MEYNHIPGNLRMPYVAEYSEPAGNPLPLTAPSAIHLLSCFPPDSQQRGLSVGA